MVVSLFHVTRYPTTNADFMAMCHTAATHLPRPGLFLFDGWYGPAVLADPPRVRVRRASSDDAAVTLPYLGQERFGIGMTLSSLAVILSALDLGVANGLVSLVADAKTGGDHEKLQTTVTRGVQLLVVIGVAAGAVIAGAMRLLDFHRLFKIESADVARDAVVSILVFITF